MTVKGTSSGLAALRRNISFLLCEFLSALSMALWLSDHMMAVAFLPGWYVPPGRKSPHLYSPPLAMQTAQCLLWAEGLLELSGPMVALTPGPDDVPSPAVETRSVTLPWLLGMGPLSWGDSHHESPGGSQSGARTTSTGQSQSEGQRSYMISTKQMTDASGARVTENPQAKRRPSPTALGKERNHLSQGR